MIFMRRFCLLSMAFMFTCLSCISCRIRIAIDDNKVVTTGTYSDTGGDYQEMRGDLGNFNALTFSGPFNVYYVQSDTIGVLIEGKKEDFNKVITTVENGTLNVRLKPGEYHNLVLRVTVFSPAMDNVKVVGSGNFYDRLGHISNKDVSLSSLGSGDIVLGNLSCSGFKGNSSGSGDIKVESLSCSDFVMKTLGSADLRVESLEVSGDASLSTSGSGDLSVDNASIKNNVILRTLGSGSIRINGSCMEVDASSSGSGDIKGNLTYRNIQRSERGSGSISL